MSSNITGGGGSRWVVTQVTLQDVKSSLAWYPAFVCVVMYLLGMNSKGALAVGVAKWLNLATGMCTRKRVQSAVGKFRWMARPHPFLSPLLSGPCAHYLWGPVFSSHTPVAILRSLASVWGLAVKVWSLLATIPSFVWNLSRVLSVDAARQRRLYAGGLFVDCLGSQFEWCGGEVMTQMCAELWALCMGIRLAIHRGWKHLHLVGDNLGALCQLLKLRAGLGFRSQQVILQRVSFLLSRSGLQVWGFWVPAHLIPADPKSRHRSTASPPSCACRVLANPGISTPHPKNALKGG